MNQSRREFLTKDLLGIVREVRAAWDDESDKEKTVGPDYFSSFQSCYAFLAEVPMEDLRNKAREAGIEVEGKTKYQLAKEIFSRR